jgi:transposase InsO family protein
LELKAARGWTLAEVARVFLVTRATIGAWLRRLDEQGPDALVRPATPWNRFPDAVAHPVQTLRGAFPLLGRQQAADLLLRAGLRVAPSTVRRMTGRTLTGPSPSDDPTPAAASLEGAAIAESSGGGHGVISHYPNHVWSADITLVPTALGFWVPWLPRSVVPSWPFCWHVAVVLDHFSRRVLATEAFPTPPSAAEMCALLDTAMGVARRAPKHMVTDRGCQFREEYRDWCEARGVKPRYGAVGKKGSIAVVERFMRTLKSEGLRRILVPYGLGAIREELRVFVCWYNEVRPHASLRAAAPAEVFAGVAARCAPRIEPRARYPVEDASRVPADALRLRVVRFEGRQHLPVVELDIAA